MVDPDMVVIAGHTRLAAAQQLGIEKVPVHVAEGLTPAQVKAYRLMDNRSHEDAEWDSELLGLELEDLKMEGFDLGLTGFEDDELEALLAGQTVGLTDPDDAPPAPEDPVSALGDVWVLGRHRLVCGDATSKDAVEAALAGVRPHLMVTDPPYGVEYDAAWRQRAGLTGAGAATGVVMNDDRADWRAAWELFPGSVAYVWHAGTKADVVADSLRAVRIAVRAQIVWVKHRHVLSRGHYHVQHEPVYYGVREGEDDQWRFIPEHELLAYAVKAGDTAQWQGSRKQSSVWFIEHIKSDTGHSTQKPVECMRRPIENNSSPGQAVYEPFSGSGTTIIACETTGRVCHALELDPAYVDVAVLRWQAFTGKAAVLEQSGRTFDQEAAARRASTPDLEAPAVGPRAKRRKTAKANGKTKGRTSAAARKPATPEAAGAVER